MKIRFALMFMMILPLIGITAVSSLGVTEALKQIEQADYGEQTVAITIPVSGFIHEAQVERGMSAGFIASGGVNFAKQIKEQRSKVDSAIAEMESLLLGQTSVDAKFVASVRSAAKDLQALRSSVDGLSVTVPQMASTYTAAIRAAIYLNEELTSNFGSAFLARKGVSWILLSEAKEAAGLERAMGATGFGAGEFSPTVLQRFVRFGAAQSISLDVFAKYSALAGITENVQEAPENVALKMFRDAAFENTPEAVGNFAAPEWFAASTAWVERLRKFELTVAEAVVASAAKARETAIVNLWIYLASAAAALISSLIAGWIVSRQLVRGFSGLSDGMAQVAEKDFESPIVARSKISEIVKLSKSLTTMRDDLAKADVKLRSAFSKSFAFGDSDSAMVIVNPDIEITSLNDSARALFSDHAKAFSSQVPNFDAASAKGASLLGLMGGDVNMKDLFADESALPWRGDIDLGGIKLELNISMVRSEKGNYAGNVIEARDVTGTRMRAGIMDAINSNQCVAELDLSGKVVSVNDNIAEMIGEPASSIVGRPIRDLLVDEEGDTEQIISDWSHISSGQSLSGVMQLETKSGSEDQWVRGTFSPVLDSAGNAFKAVLLGEDITEGKKYAARVQAEKIKADEERNLVVQTLENGLQQMAGGNLAHRIDAFFAPEYKSLRMDYNAAQENLSKAMQDVAVSAHQVNANSKELNDAATDLATRTERQAARLMETASALDEVTETVQQTATRAKDASEAVERAKTDADENEKSVKNAVDVMELISSSSKEIASITTLIDDISFQTNLLALNAGVEAARAGDAGRGFAVVASEVRTLAQRAADAASEINALIDKSSQHVESGVGLVSSVGDSLTEIVQQIAIANDRVSGIKLATEEQASALESLNNSVSEIGDLTQQNAAMGEESSALSAVLQSDANALTSTVSAFSLQADNSKQLVA